MVDKIYKAIYNQPSKFRAMSVSKDIAPDYWDTPQEAIQYYLIGKPQDFFVVETFPGHGMFPVYGDNVKEDCE